MSEICSCAAFCCRPSSGMCRAHQYPIHLLSWVCECWDLPSSTIHRPPAGVHLIEHAITGTDSPGRFPLHSSSHNPKISPIGSTNAHARPNWCRQFNCIVKGALGNHRDATPGEALGIELLPFPDLPPPLQPRDGSQLPPGSIIFLAFAAYRFSMSACTPVKRSDTTFSYKSGR